MEGTKSAVPRPVTGHGRAFNCYLPRHGLSNTLFLPCEPRDGANRPGLIYLALALAYVVLRVLQRRSYDVYCCFHKAGKLVLNSKEYM